MQQTLWKKYMQAQARWSRKKRILIFAAIIVILFASFFLFKVERTFSLFNGKTFWKIFSVDNAEREIPKEPNRIDILILGLRGKGNEQYGEYLTDTMMVLSIKTDAKKAALISVPRDLYVKIPAINKLEKINSAYAYGIQMYGDGISTSRRAIENVTGINIDYVVAVDFNAFKKMVDIVGGIDVNVPRDFSEVQQWGWEFHVPKGVNHMNGETALYYARSRYSTSDFDRARRQQDILEALADRVISLQVLSSPVKMNRILDAVSEHVKTDIDFVTMLGLVPYAKTIQSKDITRIVLDDSEGGLLTSGHIQNAYVLYPKIGIEDYTAIRERLKTIF